MLSGSASEGNRRPSSSSASLRRKAEGEGRVGSMRILLLGLHHAGQIRGASTAIHGLARALVRDKHDVTRLQAARGFRR